MPIKSCNIPDKVFYPAISDEILRISKATTKFRDFIKSTKIIILGIPKQWGLSLWG